MAYITTRTILDHTVEVRVNQDGEFTVSEKGEHGVIARGESLKQALRAARMEYRKEQIRVAVPFTYMVDGQLLPAMSRGFHAKDRYKLLIWIDDGTPDGRNDQIQIWGYGRNSNYLIPDIPEKDIRRITKLLERRVKLAQLTTECQALIEEWQTNHTFDLRAATQKALDEAAKTEPEDTEDTPDSPVATIEDKEVDELLGE
jgi:hypothetical protein